MTSKNPSSRQTTTKLNIQVETSNGVESVKMELSGAQNKTTIASRLPYSLYGDIAGDYRGSSFAIGNYSLTVTPYSENCLEGNQGASMTITFEISPGVSSDHSSRLKPYFSYDLSFLFIKLRSKDYSITISFPCIEK